MQPEPIICPILKMFRKSQLFAFIQYYIVQLGEKFSSTSMKIILL
ncbi:hypothetical protein EDF88_4298 [Buttiauxella sp. BIGb0552]|nr:hypothetical protein EDF88_4298 [Buttiauxella sp. BIGb0552]